MAHVDGVKDDAVATAARLATAYILSLVGEVLRTIPIDLVDLLIVTAVSNANLAAGPGDTALGARRTPAHIGISRNAVSRALNIPLETVRRRVAGLIARQVLAARPDGLVFMPDNPLGLGDNAALQAFNLQQLRTLFHNLKALGVALD
ncbi:MAG: hypothetical protein WDM91_14395 [Rhizomicrobium sp.]